MNYKKTLLTLLFSLFLQLGFAQLPDISFLSCEIDNWETGKYIELKVTLVNNGEAATENDTHVRLTSDNKYVTIIDEEGVCGPLAVKETKELVFTVMISKLIPHDSDVTFNIESVLEVGQEIRCRLRTRKPILSVLSVVRQYFRHLVSRQLPRCAREIQARQRSFLLLLGMRSRSHIS